MIQIEVIGLDPPCEMCLKLEINAKRAVEKIGVNAVVTKKQVLSNEILNEYGLLLSPALVIDGGVVSQGQMLSVKRIALFLCG